MLVQKWAVTHSNTSVVTRCHSRPAKRQGSHSAGEHAGQRGQQWRQQPAQGTQKKNKQQGRPTGEKGARWTPPPGSGSGSGPARIKNMQLPELQQLVAQQGSSLTPSSLAAVVLRAAKLRPPPSRQQQAALVVPTWEALRSQLGACKAYEVVLLLWAAAKLGYADADVYDSTLQHLLAPKVLSRLQPRNLSNLMYAVATAPAAVRAQHARPTLQAVLPVLQQQLHAANAQDLANVCWALGTLGLTRLQPVLDPQEPQGLLQQLLEHTQRQLDTMTPQGVSNTVWALARLSGPAPEPLLLALIQQLLAQAARASAHDAASSLWGLATIWQQQQQQQQEQQEQQQGSEEGLVDQEQQGAGQAQQGVSAELRACVLELLAIAAAPPVGPTKCHSLALALWATAKMGVEVPRDQLQQLLGLCVQHSRSATAQDASNILWACATMHTQQQGQGRCGLLPVLQQHQADALLAAAAAGAASAEAQAVANTLWAVAKLGLQVPVAQLKRLVKPFTALCMSGAASTQEVANVMWALATLQSGSSVPQPQPQQQEEEVSQVPEPVPSRVPEVLVEAFVQRVQEASAQEVCNVLWAAAKLQYCVDSWQIQQLADHVLGQPDNTPEAAASQQGSVPTGQQQRQQGLGPLEAANLLWSLATLQQLQKQQAARNVPLPLPLAQLQLLLAEVWGSLDSAGEQVLSNSLRAAAGFEPCLLPEGLLSQAALSTLAARVGGMGLQAVSNLAYALGQLGAVEAKPVLVLLLQRGLQLVQQAASSSSVALQQSSEPQAAGSGSTSTSRLHQAQAVANLCWSAAVLDVRGHTQLLTSLVGAAAAGHGWEAVTPVGASQLFMLHMALQLQQQEEQQQQQQQQSLPPLQPPPPPPQQQQQQRGSRQPAPASAGPAPGLAVCLTAQQLAQCEAAWLSCGINPQDTGESVPGGHPAAGALPAAAAPGFGLQRKVFLAARQLQGLLQSPCYEAPTPDRLFSIDIQAQTASGVRLAIEVDGSSHFRLPDLALTGTTLFRNRQLAARGYVLVSVPYFGWNTAVAAQRQQQGALGSGGQGVQAEQPQLQPAQSQEGATPTEAGAVVVEGLLGVEYLQGLVDAAVLAAAGAAPAGQGPAASAAPAPSSRQRRPRRRRRVVPDGAAASSSGSSLQE